MSSEDWGGGRDAFIADVAVKLSKLIEERDAAANRLREIECLAQDFERALRETLEHHSDLDRAWVKDEVSRQSEALSYTFREELQARTRHPSQIAESAAKKIQELEQRADTLINLWTSKFNGLSEKVDESNQRTSSLIEKMDTVEQWFGNLNLAKWLTWIVMVGGAMILYSDLSSSISSLSSTISERLVLPPH